MTDATQPNNKARIFRLGVEDGREREVMFLKSNVDPVLVYKKPNMDALSVIIPDLIDLTYSFVMRQENGKSFKDATYIIDDAFIQYCKKVHNDFFGGIRFSWFSRLVNVSMMNLRAVLASHDIPYNARALRAWAETFDGKLDGAFVLRLKERLKEMDE